MNTKIRNMKELNEKILQEVVKHYLIDSKFADSLRFETNEPLKKLFPEPENNSLRTAWRNGFADVLVYRHNKPVCIIYPKMYNKYSNLRDYREENADQLAEMNKVKVLRIVFKDLDELDLPTTKKLIKKYIYKE